MRAVAVVLAVLIGAYGLEPGALTTTLLLIMYALARYAAITGLAWYRFTRRRMVGITPVKLLDDAPRRMRSFQRVTLRIFDLPHHPRRLRQAVRTWREWRANREALEMNAAADAGVRGDTLANLHDPDNDYFSGEVNKNGDVNERGPGSGSRGSADGRGFEPRTSRSAEADSPNELSRAIERSPLYAALESCALTRAIPPETLRTLAMSCARGVRVASGEDVYRGRVLEDEPRSSRRGRWRWATIAPTYTATPRWTRRAWNPRCSPSPAPRWCPCSTSSRDRRGWRARQRRRPPFDCPPSAMCGRSGGVRTIPM